MNKHWLFALGLSAIIAGCSEEKDYFGETVDRPEGEYFDFATRGDVAVTLDLGAVAANSVYEIYLENPVVENEDGSYSLRKDLTPAYSNTMDATGSCQMTANLPTAAEKVYLVNRNPFLPRCVELDVTNGAISYAFDGSAVTAPLKDTKKVYQRDVDKITFGDGIVPVENRYKNEVITSVGQGFYTLCEWKNGTPFGKNPIVTPGYAEPTTRDQADMDTFYSQVADFYPADIDNREHVKGPEAVNIITTENDEMDHTNINVVFMGEEAGWHSAFGYIYYKPENRPDPATLANNPDIPKYIIMPDATDNVADKGSNNSWYYTYGMFDRGATIHLQFFGENYDQEPSYNFPPGYEIAWFAIANGTNWSSSNGTSSWSFKTTGFVGGFRSSLDVLADGKCRSFASATNTEHDRMYIGVEDKTTGSDYDYNDLMFFVETNPVIVPDETPELDEKEEIITLWGTEGTYGFEDQWPTSGDYDLNDVVVEYTHNGYSLRTIYYRDKAEVDVKNEMKSLESTFTFVQDPKAATYNNAFGIQLIGLNKSDVASITLNGQPVEFEAGNSGASILIAKNANSVIGKTFKLVIDFKADAPVLQNVVYDPFIVEDNDGSAADRKEVHLPKMEPTDLGYNGANIHQYYVEGLTGAYPFAIDIPVKGWEQVKETIAIGSEGQYPTFRNWADSFGANNADWYLHKN